MWLWPAGPQVLRGLRSENVLRRSDGANVPGVGRWVLSNLLMFVLSTLLSTAVLWGAKTLFYSLAPDGIYSVGVITAPWAIVLYMMALAAVIAFNYWVAYRIYSRMQAVNNKWFNL